MKKTIRKAFSLVEISIVVIIIGVLVGGIMAGSRLLEKSRLSAAQNITNKSPVMEIDNLAVWFETTLDNTFVNTLGTSDIRDQERIAVWKNNNPQSALKSDALPVAAVENGEPFYVRRGINGLPSVFFNGNEGATSGNILNVATHGLASSEVTVFMVAQERQESTAEAVVILQNTDLISGYFIALIENDLSTIFQTYEGNSVILSAGQGMEVNETELYTFVARSNDNIFYKNGVAVSTNNENTYRYPTTNTLFMIGGGQDGENILGFFNGYIGEIIIYGRALDNEERRDVEKYLARKWGLSLQ